jgi:hypothetical protein
MGMVLSALAFSEGAQAQTVGIPKEKFAPHYRAQRTMTWCWASSAEMALSYQGIRVPQEAIVTRIKGIPIPVKGSAYDIIKATNAVLLDENRRAIVVSGQFVTGAPLSTVLYNHLRRQRPVILTYVIPSIGQWSGHAVVLIGADYTWSRDTVVFTRVHVADPLPYTQTTDADGKSVVREDPAARFRKYDLVVGTSGLEMRSEGKLVGIISGALFMDGTEI